MKASNLNPEKKYVFMAVHSTGKVFWVSEGTSFGLPSYHWTEERKNAIIVNGADKTKTSAIQKDRKKTAKYLLQGFAEIQIERAKQ